ncbi:hypothetical protein BDW62DRAFT_179877 [Aspergillus aurantiobrunneus]
MRPISRDDFTTAIICALPLEAEAVKAAFDENYDTHGQYYGKQPGDENVYVNGRIGDHNVVLCYLQNPGKASAASVASTLRVSYWEVKLVLVVGICGGLPFAPENRQIFLGDVIISDSLIEYDFGSQYPSEFEQKKTRRTLNREALTLLASLRESDTRTVFQSQLSMHLDKIQQSHERWRIPASGSDIVYKSNYYHKHHGSTAAGCACSDGDNICKEVLRMDCMSLGCGKSSISRERSSVDAVRVYIGPIASADTVMKSGLHRDNLAKKDGVIAFEMEGAGVWDGMSTCLIMKGVSDYADSHKDKKWQYYAAATAASAAKTLLVHYRKPMSKGRKKCHWVVPFPQNPDFSGRRCEIKQLERLISLPNGPKKLAISGLGGIGKTQVALELAYRLRNEYPVLWIPCTSIESIEQGYINIMRAFRMDDANPTEAKKYVKAYLSVEVTKWLLILDNVDDSDVWKSLKDILPHGTEGYILVTTRSRGVAVQVASSHYVPLVEPDEDSAINILHKKLKDKRLLKDRSTTIALLKQLAYLPLAITQAASYLNITGITLANYMELLSQQESEFVRILSFEFTDEGRYDNTTNRVAATWLASFHQIQKLNPSAADFLKLMACVNNYDIPQTFLPPLTSLKDKFDALGLLSAFSFITIHPETGCLNWHRLVHLATRNWMRQEQNFSQYLHQAAERLEESYPGIGEGTRRMRGKYLPHAMSLISEKEFNQEDYNGLLFKIAQGLSSDDRYIQAQGLFTKVMEIRKERYGDRDPSTIVSMAHVADTYLKLALLEKAEEIACPALVTSKEVLGPVASDTLFIIVVLTAVYEGLNKWAKVYELNLQILKALQSTEGPRPDRHEIWKYMSTIADSYQKRRKMEKAYDIYIRILNSQENTLGSNHPDTLATMKNLASIYRELEMWEEAREVLTDILKACNYDIEFQPRLFITAQIELANIHMGLREWKQAEKLATQAVKAATEVLGPQNAVTLTANYTLAKVYMDQDRLQEAEKLATQAVKVANEVFGPQNPNTWDEISTLAIIYERQRRWDEAAGLKLQILEVLDEEVAVERSRKYSTLLDLSWIYSRQGRQEDAEAIQEQAYKVRTRESILGPKHPDVLDNTFNAAMSFIELGGGPHARKLMARAVELANDLLGPNDPKTEHYASILSDLHEAERAEKERIEKIENGEEDEEVPNTELLLSAPDTTQCRKVWKTTPKAILKKAWKTARGSRSSSKPV